MRAALVLILASTIAGCWSFDPALLARDGGTSDGSDAQTAGTCDVTLQEGDIAIAEPPLASMPALGAITNDPTWGTCVRRLTDLEGDASATPSHRVVENADRTLLMVQTDGYEWIVYEADTLERVGGLGLHTTEEPYWHPTSPNVVRHLDGATGEPFVLRELDVLREITTDVWDFTGALRAVFPDAAAVRPSFGALGRTASTDLARWAVEVIDASDARLGFAILDASTQTIVSTFADPGTSTSRVALALSPSGEHALRVDCDGASTVHRASDASLVRTFATFEDCPQDWDFAHLHDGREAVLYATLDWLRAQALDDGSEIDVLDLTWDDGEKSIGVRVSGTGHARPGWAAISVFRCQTDWRSVDCATGTRAHQDRLVLMELLPERGERRVLNLAWHRATYDDSQSVPVPSASRALDRVHFVSTGGASGSAVDLYEIRLPPGAP
ncbi:hypothetical protein [Sandaracinus amylolyticus]|uniref:hypothetical protein n=1 Tax=Sandaracinus amylolyticus TaxID=927083 RepID=UPI001F217D07|nr:hypothetical protein [Sandaracinus amylolyticus]